MSNTIFNARTIEILTSIKSRGISLKSVEINIGLSNGVLGKYVKGKANVSERNFYKIKAYYDALPPVDIRQVELPAIIKPQPQWVEVISEFMKSNGIVYTDLIEAYEFKKQHYENLTKDKQPKFVPQNGINAGLLASWGWDIVSYKTYLETVVPRRYKSFQFINIIKEENDNIELLKLICEIKKADHLSDIDKGRLMMLAYDKLN